MVNHDLAFTTTQVKQVPLNVMSEFGYQGHNVEPVDRVGCNLIEPPLPVIDPLVLGMFGHDRNLAGEQIPQELPGIRLGYRGNVLRCANGHDSPAVVAPFRTKINDPVGGLDDV